MNNDGAGLIYTDQAAAEVAAAAYRRTTVDLLSTLTELNESLDSVKLAAVITDCWVALKR